MAIGDHLRLLADETRLRVLHLLAEEPLTVAELQDVLELGQSSISGHLAKLKQAGLTHDVPEGSARRYRLRDDLDSSLKSAWLAVRSLSANEAQTQTDHERLIALRQRRGSSWVDRVAGSLHREYAPGRTWESLCHGFIRLAHFGRCVDIGAGDGAMTELIAPQSRVLTCVDPSSAMLAAARARVATLQLTNVNFVEASGEKLPLPDASADTVLFLQSLQYMTDPERALSEAIRILAPGGTLLVVTLVKHTSVEADAFGHQHRGFTPEQLTRWTRTLQHQHTDELPRETRSPHFQTIILSAKKSK
jgi:SAM-dependent methyltransferase